MNTQTRLALFVPDLRGAGAERVMTNLACGLIEQGYHVDLLLFQVRGTYLSQIPPSVRIINLKARHMLLSLPGVVRYLKREKPAAMLSALNQPNTIAVWARRIARSPARIAISIHNHLSVESQSGKSLRLKMMPFFAKRYYSWADAIIAVSGGVADDLAQMTGLPRARIQVIYNPVISEELLAKSRQPLAHPWFAPGEPPVVLAVGRLTNQKDFGTLLRAFAVVRATRSVRLLILGEGEERAALEALICELGIGADVSLTGFSENPFAYMRNAALLAMSSKFEGLPTVMIEALACGCPVVSTDCPSGPSEILAGGRWGRLAPVGDVGALASAMEASLAAERVSPPPASWAPYEIGVVTREYAQMLLPE